MTSTQPSAPSRSPRSSRRWWLLSVVGLLVLLLVAGGTWWFVERSSDAEDPDAALPGVREGVEVIRGTSGLFAGELSIGDGVETVLATNDLAVVRFGERFALLDRGDGSATELPDFDVPLALTEDGSGVGYRMGGSGAPGILVGWTSDGTASVEAPMSEVAAGSGVSIAENFRQVRPLAADAGWVQFQLAEPALATTFVVDIATLQLISAPTTAAATAAVTAAGGAGSLPGPAETDLGGPAPVVAAAEGYALVDPLSGQPLAWAPGPIVQHDGWVITQVNTSETAGYGPTGEEVWRVDGYASLIPSDWLTFGYAAVPGPEDASVVDLATGDVTTVSNQQLEEAMPYDSSAALITGVEVATTAGLHSWKLRIRADDETFLNTEERSAWRGAYVGLTPDDERQVLVVEIVDGAADLHLLQF